MAIAVVLPQESARSAGLRYVNSSTAGLTRIRFRRDSNYIDSKGRRIRDKETLERIRRLVLPPAWERVWISPHPTAHLQATGYDARGRKQYRYHASYRAIRDSAKFDRLLAFGKALPKIEAALEADLKLNSLQKRKLSAAVVRLLKVTSIRVGNDEYAKSNNSFGLTTMHNRHVQVIGEHIRFRFRGKSKVAHDITLTDGRLAAIIRKCRCIPGSELFQYVDAAGGIHSLDSGDVNEYLFEVSGEKITAKDFRTWNGSCLAINALLNINPEEGTMKQRIVHAVQQVAQRLGNKPATCRKFYIHPSIILEYESGNLSAMRSRMGGKYAEAKLLLRLLTKAA